MTRPTLDALGRRYQTDKAGDRHNFLSIYEPYLERFRDAPIRILEIGVLGGGSLQTWREYFPRAEVIGIDVEPACSRFNGERIQVFIGDGADAALLAGVLEQTGAPDIVIDDGSHDPRQQRDSFQFLYPRLAPEGLYIVEDLQTSYWTDPEWGGESSYVRDTLAGHIDGVLYPCREVKADHGDRRNSPHWPAIQAKMSDFERQTKAIHLYTGTAIYEKWAQGERY